MRHPKDQKHNKKQILGFYSNNQGEDPVLQKGEYKHNESKKKKKEMIEKSVENEGTR